MSWVVARTTYIKHAPEKKRPYYVGAIIIMLYILYTRSGGLFYGFVQCAGDVILNYIYTGFVLCIFAISPGFWGWCANIF